MYYLPDLKSTADTTEMQQPSRLVRQPRALDEKFVRFLKSNQLKVLLSHSTLYNNIVFENIKFKPSDYSSNHQNVFIHVYYHKVQKFFTITQDCHLNRDNNFVFNPSLPSYLAEINNIKVQNFLKNSFAKQILDYIFLYLKTKEENTNLQNESKIKEKNDELEKTITKLIQLNQEMGDENKQQEESFKTYLEERKKFLNSSFEKKIKNTNSEEKKLFEEIADIYRANNSDLLVGFFISVLETNQEALKVFNNNNSNPEENDKKIFNTDPAMKKREKLKSNPLKFCEKTEQFSSVLNFVGENYCKKFELEIFFGKNSNSKIRSFLEKQQQLLHFRDESYYIYIPSDDEYKEYEKSCEDYKEKKEQAKQEEERQKQKEKEEEEARKDYGDFIILN